MIDTSSPASPAQPDIRIVVQKSKFSTHVCRTARRVAAAGLEEHGLAIHTAEIVRQRRELILYAVRDTFWQRAARIVEILMRLIDQFGGGPVIILDGRQSRGRGSLKSTDSVVISAGEKDHLGRGAVMTNGFDGNLNAGSPGGHVEIVRLVHQAEDDVALRGVFPRELGPETGELLIRWSSLTDDATVPAGVVVHVEDAEGACCETCLHDLVVGVEEGLVQWTSEIVVDEVLPSDG